MKTLYCSLPLAAMCFTAQAQSTNIMNIGAFGVRPPIPFPQRSELSIFETALDRIEERAESRLTHRLILDQLDQDFGKSTLEEAAKRSKSLISDGFKYSIREWGLGTGVYAWLDEKFEHVGDWFSSFWRDTLSGKEERNNVQSPANLDFVQERRRFSGIKAGIRPFNLSNPRTFIGYGWKRGDTLIAESTLMLSLKHWHEPRLSLTTEVPIGKWILGVGVEKRFDGKREFTIERGGRLFTNTDRPLDITVGLKRHLSHRGVVLIGADVLEKRAVGIFSMAF